MPDPRTDPFRCRAVGDSMSPAIDHGDVVNCCPAEWTRDGFRVGREYVVGLAAGPVVLCVVLAGAPPGRVRLGVWNTAYAGETADVPLTDVAWAARVVVVARAGMTDVPDPT